MTSSEIAERIRSLCEARGVSANKMLEDCGLSHNMLQTMKKGTIPSADRLEKIADYFGVSIDYIMGRKASDAEVEDMVEYLATRKEARMLFDLAKDATPEDIIQAIRIIEVIKQGGKETEE